MQITRMLPHMNLSAGWLKGRSVPWSLYVTQHVHHHHRHHHRHHHHHHHQDQDQDQHAGNVLLNLRATQGVWPCIYNCSIW